MGRSLYRYTVRDVKEAKEIAERILQENSFRQKTLRTGEQVWVKGNALVASQQFVSLFFIEAEHEVLVYAWTQGGFGIPGMGEKEVESLGGFIPKRQLAKVIVAIEDALKMIRL